MNFKLLAICLFLTIPSFSDAQTADVARQHFNEGMLACAKGKPALKVECEKRVIRDAEPAFRFYGMEPPTLPPKQVSRTERSKK